MSPGAQDEHDDEERNAGGRGNLESAIWNLQSGIREGPRAVKKRGGSRPLVEVESSFRSERKAEKHRLGERPLHVPVVHGVLSVALQGAYLADDVLLVGETN